MSYLTSGILKDAKAQLVANPEGILGGTGIPIEGCVLSLLTAGGGSLAKNLGIWCVATFILRNTMLDLHAVPMDRIPNLITGSESS